jgi:hypothetical protein
VVTGSGPGIAVELGEEFLSCPGIVPMTLWQNNKAYGAEQASHPAHDLLSITRSDLT